MSAPLGQNAGREVARGALGMFGLKVAYSLLAFALGLVLARFMGVTAYGRYAYASTWGLFFSAPAVLGLDQFLARQVAGDRARGDYRHLRALLRTANISGAVGAATFASLAAIIAVAAGRLVDRDALTTILIGLFMVPILTFMRIRQASLSGLGQVVRGQWPELLLRPAAMIIMIGAWRVAYGSVSSQLAMAFTIISSAAMLALGAWLLRRSLPSVEKAVSPARVSLPWRSSLVPLAGLATVQMLQGQADVLLLGLLAPAAAVGIYGVASRGAILVVFFLNAANPALGPEVAALKSSGDIAQIERVVRQVTRTTTWLSLPVVLGFALFGRYYLALFGPAFVAGILPLVVLAFAQFINVACGPVGTVLIMTGHEPRVARAVSLSSSLNVLASAVLIPHWGPLGAAVGSASSIVLWNVLLVRQVRLRLGINCTAFGKARLVHDGPDARR